MCSGILLKLGDENSLESGLQCFLYALKIEIWNLLTQNILEKDPVASGSRLTNLFFIKYIALQLLDGDHHIPIVCIVLSDGDCCK